MDADLWLGVGVAYQEVISTSRFRRVRGVGEENLIAGALVTSLFPGRLLSGGIWFAKTSEMF